VPGAVDYAPLGLIIKTKYYTDNGIPKIAKQETIYYV